MKFDLRQRFTTLAYTYAAIGLGLLVSLLMGATHLRTLNFWLTAALAFAIVTVFDGFVLSVLHAENITPSKFLFRMMMMVVTMQIAFAGIYYWASDARSYLSRGGVPISDFVDASYFSGVTLLTVGYGDIVPVGDFRFTAVAEVYGGTLFIFAFFTWGLGMIAHRGNYDRREK